MANIKLQAKRELIAQGYVYWVKSITGSSPKVSRTLSGRKIILSPAQTEAMSKSIYESMTSESSPDDLNVSMPWGDILMPAAVKLYWPYALGTTLAIGGLGFLLGKR